MTTFSYTSGDPGNLVGGANADMADIKGPFDDLENWLNGLNITDTNVQAAGLSLSRLVPLILYGSVDGNTGAIVNAGSGGWSSSRSAAGQYTLTFSPAFSSAPIVVALANFGGGAMTTLAPTIAAVNCVINTNLITGGNPGQNANFSFIAIGAR